MIAYLIGPILVISVSVFLVMRYKKNAIIHKSVTNTNYLTLFLIILTLIGFFIQEDFTEDCGCFVGTTRDVFSIDYIIFSLISIALISLSLLMKRGFIGVVFLAIELIYWLIKLFVLKSGYVGGMGILVFKVYDFIGLTTRIWLIYLLLDLKFREFIIPIIAGIIITIKMFFFPCQENKAYENYLKPYYNDKLFDKLNGEWTGNLLGIDTVTYYRPFDSTNINDLIIQHETEIYGDTLLWKVIKEFTVLFNDSSLLFYDSISGWERSYKIYNTFSEEGYILYFPTEYRDLMADTLFTDTLYQKILNMHLSNNDSITISRPLDNTTLLILDNKNSR